MKFEPLYYSERLKVISPYGDIGIVTLWSPVRKVERKLLEWGIDLTPSSSRVAVIANLYGNGLPQMLRNLLWNPQISYLIVLGQDLSGSATHLYNFFSEGLEEAEMLGTPTFRIRKTNRFIDGAVTPDDFTNRPLIKRLGTITAEETRSGIKKFLSGIPPRSSCTVERVRKELPQVEVSRFPSNTIGHTVFSKRGVLSAWQELIFRIFRFGVKVKLKKGERIELLNMKVVIENPVEDPDELVSGLGFDPIQFREYQKRILEKERRESSYTYGNRIRAYFKNGASPPVDYISNSVERLKMDKESRHCYISLWDSARDGMVAGSPCLVSLFSRVHQGRLTLTATFRTHNALTAWPENVWGLIAIQRAICSKIDIPAGAITIISHSISIDGSPDQLARAELIAARRVSDDETDLTTGKRQLRLDPNGEFSITTDRDTGEIVALHSYDGLRLTEYRGRSAQEIESQIARDCAVSDISHALYIGRELAKAEQQLFVTKP